MNEAKVKQMTKQAALVLGMHRSGTSLLAKGINALGYHLGDNLMPASKDNEKGYWEDLDVVAFNDRLLADIGCSWDLAYITRDLPLGDLKAHLDINSFDQLINTKFAAYNKVAIKDPRVSMLAPLWVEQLQKHGFETKVIVCLRDPVAVAASLSRRDAFPFSKALQLWQEHYMSVLSGCLSDVVIVEYEQLLSEPSQTIARLAEFLEVDDIEQQLEDGASELNRYLKEFIDRRLDHADHQSNDLSALPPSVAALYKGLKRLAIQPVISIADVQSLISDPKIVDDELLINALKFDVVRREKSLVAKQDEIAEKELSAAEAIHVRNLTAQNIEDLRAFNGELKITNDDLRAFNEELKFSNGELKASNDALEASNNALEISNNELKTLGDELKNINSELQKQTRDLHVELDALRSERESHLSKMIRLESHVKALEGTIKAFKSSTSWRVTAPLRLIGMCIKFPVSIRSRHIPCDLQPLHEIDVSPHTGIWASTGEDPQISVSAQAGSYRPGWLQVNFSSEPLSSSFQFKPEIYLDYGEGFEVGSCVKLACENGGFSALFHTSRPVVEIRIDPSDLMGEFEKPAISVFAINGLNALVRISAKIWRRDRARGMSRWYIISSRVRQILRGGIGRYLFNHERFDHYYRASHLQESNYQMWIEENETTLTNDEVLTLLEGFSRKPLVSILVPVHNPPIEHLHDCIESVIAQSYPHWELCLVNDASTDPNVAKALDHYAQKDERIKVLHHIENGHISAASNSALKLATGEFVGLLDHDDELVQDALLTVVEKMNEQPAVKLFYSDEDKIDANGNRFQPHFKPDWNKELLLSQNYICHFLVVEKKLLDEIGGFRLGYEGSQDHDLILRCVGKLRENEIHHISKILYHWRAIEGSTAKDPSSKDYTNEAGVKAVRDAIRQEGYDVDVEAGKIPNSYRVRYPVNEKLKVCLIIPTRDQVTLTRQCVDSILDKTTYKNYEIIIVNNGSTETETLEYFEAIAKKDNIRVLDYDHPFNYSAINNFAVGHTDADIVGLINNDIEVISEEWLSEMVSHASRDGVGCVGAKLLYPDERLQHAGVILGVGGVAGHSHKYFPRDHNGYFGRLKLVQNMSAVTAACLLVKRSIYMEVGGLNEEKLTVAFNDVDFCLKVLSAGYRNLWTPYAELFHHESVSRGAEDNPEKIKRFNSELNYMKKSWGELLRQDPSYNRNLTLEHEDFSLGN